MNKPLKPVNFHIVKKEYHRDSMKELAINYAFEQCSLYKYDLYTNISVIVESKGREYKHNFKVINKPLKSDSSGYQLAILKRG